MTEVSNVTSGFMQTGAQQGWICPVCKRVLSPSMMECPCKGQGVQIFTKTMHPDTVRFPYQTGGTAQESSTITYTESTSEIEMEDK